MTTEWAGRVPGRRIPAADAVITDARPGRSRDLKQRQRTYLISMAIRISCFLAIAVVPNLWGRLALLLGAAILPGIAVLVANARERRSHPPQAFERGEPETRKALPKEPTHVVSGEVVDDD